ncbi:MULTISPECIES: hypothetical protein, partial [unclassified Microcoleus]|uniref:hypothetical protein n=1 Tax=unclassified Microcoleus TaxID=2642155 RepID=UPI002FCF2F26
LKKGGTGSFLKSTPTPLFKGDLGGSISVQLHIKLVSGRCDRKLSATSVLKSKIPQTHQPTCGKVLCRSPVSGARPYGG